MKKGSKRHQNICQIYVFFCKTNKSFAFREANCQKKSFLINCTILEKKLFIYFFPSKSYGLDKKKHQDPNSF